MKITVKAQLCYKCAMKDKPQAISYSSMTFYHPNTISRVYTDWANMGERVPLALVWRASDPINTTLNRHALAPYP